MRTFRKFTLLNIFFVYLVIFAGGLVRVSGAGLGCPDWPKCFGRWIPPTSIDQLPPDMDPAQFNITLAWIEYANRLVGVIVGFLIAALAVWAIFKFRENKRILFSAVASALLVAFQGWHGSRVVSSGLDQGIVSVHYYLALALAGLLIYVYVLTYHFDRERVVTSSPISGDLRIWSSALFLLALLQIFLGTQIRGVMETLKESLPLLSDVDRLGQVGLINHIHLLLGLIITASAFMFVLRIRKVRELTSPLIDLGAAIAALLSIVQIFLGMVFVFIGVVPLVQLFHLIIASLIVGSLIMILSVTFAKKEG